MGRVGRGADDGDGADLAIKVAQNGESDHVDDLTRIPCMREEGPTLNREYAR